MKIAWDNKADAATLTAGSQISTLPVGNLQDTRLSRKWHTAAGVEASHVLIDMASAVSADLLAVLGTNLSASAVMRLRASNLDPLALGSLRYDSGVINAGVKANYGALYKAFKAAYLTLDAAQEPTFYVDYTKGHSAPLIGDVAPTFTRATTATVTDWEGMVILVKSGEMRFQGLRREENLVATKSEDWSNAAWNKTTMTATAGDLTATAGNATCLQPLTRAAANYVLRVKLRRKTGSGNVQLTIDGAAYTTVALTTYDQVFSLSQAAVTNPNFGIRLVTNADAVYASEIGLHDTTGRSNTNPPEYVSVGVIAAAPFHGAHVDGVKYFDTENGNTVASNVVTEATGATVPMSPLPGYLSEGARTNTCIQSGDLTTGWTNENSTDAANQAIGPTGETVMDRVLATAGGPLRAGIYRGDPAVSAGQTYTFSFWIKKDNQQFVVVGERADAAWHVVVLDLDAGVLGSPTNCTARLKYCAAANAYRVSVTYTRTNGGSAQVGAWVGTSLGNAAPPTETWAGTEAFFAWGGQFENAGSESSDIPTTTASVTRNADAQSLPLTDWFNQAEGTIVFQGRTPVNMSGAASFRPLSVSEGTGNERYLLLFSSSATNFTVHDGGVQQAGINTGATAASTDVVIAAAYKVNDFAASKNGGAVGTDSAGTLPTPTTLHVGYDGANGADWFSTIARVAYYNTRLPNATLQATPAAVDYTISSRYWRLDLADTTLADNLQAGRLFLGPSWETDENQDWGWSVGYADDSEVVKTDGGQKFFDPRPRYRRIGFNLGYLTKVEALEKALEIQRANGIVGDVLAIHDIDDVHLSEEAVFGTARIMEPVLQRTATKWAQKWEVEETL